MVNGAFPSDMRGMNGRDTELSMLIPENIVVLRACVCSASKLLIFANSRRKTILYPFFLGRLPTSLSSVGEDMDINYGIVGLS